MEGSMTEGRREERRREEMRGEERGREGKKGLTQQHDNFRINETTLLRIQNKTSRPSFHRTRLLKTYRMFFLPPLPEF
jgi:hypothetical protein